LDEKFADDTLLADFIANVNLGVAALTSVTSYINRDIAVNRDASSLSGSVSVDLGFPAAAVLLPSRLVDTTDLEQFSQELRLASTGDGPFQWVFGGFYSKVDRVYNQRLPTPGYDAYTDAVLGAGTSASVANGFEANSPYDAYLPYDIKQKAVFGELNYTLGKLTATAGGRYYDFSETRQFKSGGLFANGDNRTDKTSSDGFTPRFLLSYKAADHVTFNAQASKGFRLGGVNDPLNIPLCTAQDAAIFGGYQAYDDETLWNYEGGVKSRFGGVSFNGAVFYTDIKNLQTTLDAGSCSSRVVFNVAKAHTKGVEGELRARVASGFDLSLSGSLVEAEFDSTVKDGSGAVIGGIRDGNRLPSVPKFQISINATYTRDPDRDDGRLRHRLVPARRQPLHPGQRSGDNPRSFVSGLPFGGATGNDATVRGPAAAQLRHRQSQRRPADGQRPGHHRLRQQPADENALLSFDRERGGRARLGYTIGQPRTVGVTIRKSF
jgi:iron complex outermembrane receptor protein